MAQSSNGRRSFSADFKARVARDALRETDTLKAVAARRGVHPSQVKEWRSRFEEGGKAAFRDGAKRATDQAATIKELHAKIGELTMERDFFQELWGAEPPGAHGRHPPGQSHGHRQAMPLGGRKPHGGLPARCQASVKRRPRADAPHRRTAHGASVPRRPANHGGAAAGWRADGAQPRAPADAHHGRVSGGSEAANQRQSPIPQVFSVLAQGRRGDGAGSGLVRRHHLHSAP